MLPFLAASQMGISRGFAMAAGSFDFESYYVNSTSNRTDYDYANIYIVVHGDLA